MSVLTINLELSAAFAASVTPRVHSATKFIFILYTDVIYDQTVVTPDCRSAAEICARVYRCLPIIEGGDASPLSVLVRL